MARTKTFYPKSAAEALKWIVNNEHYEGYVTSRNDQEGLILRNDSADCFILKGLLPVDAMKPSDYDVTKRMFEPTEAGLALLSV